MSDRARAPQRAARALAVRAQAVQAQAVRAQAVRALAVCATLASALALSCRGTPAFVCWEDAACDAPPRVGACVPGDPTQPAGAANPGACGFPDDTCPSGLRYGAVEGTASCVSCGALGEACCGDACDAGLVCEAGVCGCLVSWSGDIGHRDILAHEPGPPLLLEARSDGRVGAQTVDGFADGLTETPEFAGALAMHGSAVWGACAWWPDGRVLCDDLQGGLIEPLVRAKQARGYCAITTDDEVVCWSRSNLAGKVMLADVIDLDVFGPSCTVTRDGAAWCWGPNDHGQLGSGEVTSDFATTPQRVVDLPPVRRVVVGGTTSCALDLLGALWCWGDNGAGQLADGSADTLSPLPRQVIGLGEVVDVALGWEYGCAQTADGAVACWGAGIYGGTSAAPTTALQVVAGLPPRVTRLVATTGAACVLGRIDAYCWGASVPGSVQVAAPYLVAQRLPHLCAP